METKPVEQQTSPTPAGVPQTPIDQHAPVAHPTAGQLILQWLTYAFWGWFVFALSILLTTVISHIVTKADTASFTPYGISAVVVLLPIAAICDFFYSKHEPTKKTGGALVVMMIHAVLFALITVGSLIGFVFSVVQYFVSQTDTADVSKVAIISTAIVTVIYALTFVRTLSPVRLAPAKKVFIPLMSVVALVVIVLSITGPISYERSTKNDRVISNNLSTLNYAIQDYARDNNELPATLSDVSVSGDAKKLVTDGLVEYKANTRTDDSSASSRYRTSKSYYYQLCVTYKKASGSTSARRYSNSSDYDTYLSAYTHPAGDVCYKLKTTSYGTSY